MSIPFNADEIFEMAEQIERKAASFYRRAAQVTDDRGLRERLLGLAAMENEHEKVFAGMRSGLSQEEKKPAVADPWGEAVLYLRGIADGYVLAARANPAGWLTGKETKQDILRAAIGYEKDSIVFYLGMKEAVPQGRGKERIDAIIKEEMGHIAALSGELAASKQ